MAQKITARIPTVQYGYLEVEADTPAEFEEVYGYAEEKAALIVNPSGQAVANLQAQGVVAGPPPWAAPTNDEAQQFIPPASQQQPPAGWQSSVPQQQVQPTAGPSCQHGPAKWVGPGVSKRTGQPYQGFWSCQAPQGQQKCKFNS